MSPNIFISAGEASGEHYGTLLIDALKRRLGATGLNARFFGMGGERMVAAGLDRVVRAEDMAVMGITEVVLHLPRIYREFRKLKTAIHTRRPDIAILIDFPDIHFKLAKELHALGIPVLFFVSPQLWAWKKHRIELVRKYVTHMLVIFPFEEQFYRDRGIHARFVGHPLADLPLPTISREDFAAAHGLDPAKAWIGLLPGSRAKEIANNLPEMLRAAGLLASCFKEKPGNSTPQFLVPLAPTLTPAQRASVRATVNQLEGSASVHLIEDITADDAASQLEPAASVRPPEVGARAALHHARASIVASGTATVEAALIGNPFVVVYRVSALTYAIAKRVVTVPHIAMANLIAGKRVVPELIQNDFTAANIVRELQPLLPDGQPRESMKKELRAIGDALRNVGVLEADNNLGAIDRVAAIAVDVLQGEHSTGSRPAVQF